MEKKIAVIWAYGNHFSVEDINGNRVKLGRLDGSVDKAKEKAKKAGFTHYKVEGINFNSKEIKKL